MNGPRLIIAGGGLAGCLAALALKQERPEVNLLLIEEGASFGGNHIWSFFDSDVAPEDRPLVKPLVRQRWEAHDVLFPRRRRTLGFGYNSMSSALLDQHMRASLRADEYRLACRIVDIASTGVRIEGGEWLGGTAVIDARGGALPASLDLAWQKFVGRTYRFDRPHDRSRPIIMDATVPQMDGYRFVYTLPFSDTELLVEDTYYSDSPDLDVDLLRGRIEKYEHCGTLPSEPLHEEKGVLPVLLGGDVAALWPAGERPVARLGLRGGFFHPTTGYSLPDAVRNARLLARQADLSGSALHNLLRRRAATLWRERRFFQRLNRTPFRAAAPDARYRILEHFYRLPEPVIARFYAGSLTRLDKVRILTGRLPVPIGQALAAMRSSK